MNPARKPMRVSLTEIKKVAKAGGSIDARLIYKPISHYFTWLFIRLPFTPNELTTAMFFSWLVSALCMLPAEPLFVYVGYIFIILGIMFDAIDGDIARFRGTTSNRGDYIDKISHMTTYPLIFLFLAWGLYQKTEDLNFIIIGVTLLFFRMLSGFNRIAFNYITLKKGLDKNLIKSKDGPFQSLVRRFSDGELDAIFGHILLVAAIIDRLDWFIYLGAIFFTVKWVGQVLLLSYYGDDLKH